MTESNRLLDKIVKELQSEKNPIARKFLEDMKEKYLKKGHNEHILKMFDVIREKKSEQAERYPELEADLQADLAQKSLMWAKVLPEKVNVKALQNRCFGPIAGLEDDKPITEQMDEINFPMPEQNDDGQPVTDNLQEPAVELLQKLHVSDDTYSGDWKQRMHDAAHKAGLDTSKFVPIESDTAEQYVPSLNQPDVQEVLVKSSRHQFTTAPDIMESGAVLYRERNAIYGDSYKKQGTAMVAFFPDGITLKTVEDHNRFMILDTIVSKLHRYCHDFTKPHDDSVLDIMVYSAMLLELDRAKEK